MDGEVLASLITKGGMFVLYNNFENNSFQTHQRINKYLKGVTYNGETMPPLETISYQIKAQYPV